MSNIVKEAPINYFLDGDTFYIELYIPGFNKDDIDAYLQDENLIIEGERETEDSDKPILYRKKEFSIMNSFKNIFQFKQKNSDSDLTVDEITVKDGICRIKFKVVESEKVSLEVK